VICPENSNTACVAISDDKNIATVNIDIFKVEDSKMEIVQLLELEGLFTDIFHYEDSKSLISLVPFSVIEHDLNEERSYPWLNNSDVTEFSTEISNELIIYSWSNGRDNGWIITSSGNIIQFTPSELREEQRFFDEIFSVIFVGFVAAILFTTYVIVGPKIKIWFNKAFEKGN